MKSQYWFLKYVYFFGNKQILVTWIVTIFYDDFYNF